MYKIVHNLVAFPSTPFIPTVSRTAHQGKSQLQILEHISTRHRNTRSHSSLVQYSTGTLWIKTLLRVNPWASLRTVYRDLLSVYLPIGVISQLPREFADYQAEAEKTENNTSPATARARQQEFSWSSLQLKAELPNRWPSHPFAFKKFIDWLIDWLIECKL